MTYIFEFGGMWEYSRFEIWTDVEVNMWSGIRACKHCHSYNPEPSPPKFICPRVVVAANEGGFNCTGVCLDCIVEAADSISEIKIQNNG